MSKNNELGMNPATASNRLVKDLLFDFVSKTEIVCYRCGQPMTRESFSIEHKEPWRNSPRALELFFDLKNITFSHLKCNSAAASRVYAPCGTRGAYNRGCKCDDCRKWKSERDKKYRPPEKRREYYLRNGT